MIEFVFSLILVFSTAKELELQQYAFLTSNHFLIVKVGFVIKELKLLIVGVIMCLEDIICFHNKPQCQDQLQICCITRSQGIKTTEYTLRIDSWDNEFIQLWADGVKVFEKSFFVSDGYQICGWDTYLADISASPNELAYQLDVTFPHTVSTVYLEFKDTLDQPPEDESWGIRDIKISIVFNCPSECDQVTI